MTDDAPLRFRRSDIGLPSDFGQPSKKVTQSKRKIGGLQPLGDMNSHFKPTRVNSSTSSSIKDSTSAAWSDDTGASFDPELGLSPAEAHALMIGDSDPSMADDAASFLGL